MLAVTEWSNDFHDVCILKNCLREDRVYENL